MKKLWSLGTGLLVLGLIVGCKTTAAPDLIHPRSAEVQQKRALRYDPYPETNVAPDMVGVRPRGYENPPAEVSRSRWVKDPKSNAERWGTYGLE